LTELTGALEFLRERKTINSSHTLIQLSQPNFTISVAAEQSLSMKESPTDKDSVRVDAAYKIHVGDPDNTKYLCFLEQQHIMDKNIGKRMFDRYVRYSAELPEIDITCFVLHTGRKPREEINQYSKTFLETKAGIMFETFYLSDYKLEDLINDKRPFSKAIYIGRLQQTTKSNYDSLIKAVNQIKDVVLSSEMTEEENVAYFNFARKLFRLQSLETDPKLPKEFTMEFVSPEEAVKRLYLQEGREEGREEGRVEIAFEIVKNMLTKMSIPDIIASTGLQEEVVLSIQKSASLEDFMLSLR
jgi:hypothetical protein